MTREEKMKKYGISPTESDRAILISGFGGWNPNEVLQEVAGAIERYGPDCTIDATTDYDGCVHDLIVNYRRLLSEAEIDRKIAEAERYKRLQFEALKKELGEG